jgi:S1-C subfamily serine protease
VSISNALRDTQKVRWYFKKRFVFIMLFLFAPLGLVLLWVGSRFKRITKIIYTVIFVSFFIFNSISNEKKYKAFVDTAPFEKITQMIQKQKLKVFLSHSPAQGLKNVGFTRIQGKKRIKLAVSDIYARYSQGIVSITVKNKDGSEMGEGSGFVLTPDGLIVTNFHVISKAYSAVVKVGAGSTYQASLVKAEPRFDIAVLKINTKGLLPLAIGNSDEVLSGQVVVAIGSPMGFEQSVSSGIVSAVRPGSMKLIQITAPVSPGSSGGPLLNEYGEVIGITTIASFFMAQNLNFAIPINYLEKIISQE